MSRAVQAIEAALSQAVDHIAAAEQVRLLPEQAAQEWARVCCRLLDAYAVAKAEMGIAESRMLSMRRVPREGER